MPHSRCTWRRIISRVALYGALGFATTVAVAWTGAAFEPVTRSADIHITDAVDSDDYVLYGRSGGVLFTFWHNGGTPKSRAVWREVRDGFLKGGLDRFRADPSRMPLFLERRKERFTSLAPGEWNALPNVIYLAAGFPMRAFWSKKTFIVKRQQAIQGIDLRHVWTGAIDVFEPIRPVDANARALPYLPIWSGLFVDTAFWSGGWFAALLLPRRARRALRKRKGLCPRCAYDLRRDFAAGCPECAWNKPAVT